MNLICKANVQRVAGGNLAAWPIRRLDGLLVVIACLCMPGYVLAQPGLKESLERLDTDRDGRISPSEITPLARPYFERLARMKRISLDRSNTIERILDTARIHYAVSNGISGRTVRPVRQDTVLPFGPERNKPLVPEFGLDAVKYSYTQDDVDEAYNTLRRYDQNGDGFVDRQEAAVSKWTHRNPFLDDLNKDGRLSRMELTQRYARRRLLERTSDQMWQKARRVGNGIRVGASRSSESSDDRRREFTRWWSRGGTRNWLTASLLSRFDANKNGRLEAEEAEKLGFPAGQVDLDRNSEISREELFAYVSNLQDQAGDVVAGLPGWFYELDLDRDGQVSMREFTEEWTEQKLAEFNLHDANNDGLITAAEVQASKGASGGTYENDTAEILPPRKTIISEIEVEDDIIIGDVNVQLSMTHTNVSMLDGYLIGPDGQRVELFTEVGGTGDHFEKTTFDDQSRTPITKARAPFQGSYLPEAPLKRQPSLSHFNDKSAKGVWQLVIRGTRNERFGLLHRWSLIVQPKDVLSPGDGLPTSESESAKSETPKSGTPKPPASKQAAIEKFESELANGGESRRSAVAEGRQKEAAMKEKMEEKLRRYRESRDRALQLMKEARKKSADRDAALAKEKKREKKSLNRKKLDKKSKRDRE